MTIAVASGKGGTGKTTVAVSLALSLEGSVVLMDCDVEAPNSHIFLHPIIAGEENVYISVPRIDESKCNGCGECSEICQFNAIVVPKNKPLLFLELCHGCGGCAMVCPKGAISEEKRKIGVVEEGWGMGIHSIHGSLSVGEPISPPIIKKIKQKQNTGETVIIDSPPGTTCPAVESVRGSDYAILVAEPTPFGLNDLILSVEMVKKLAIPCGVVLNRWDDERTIIEDYCLNEGIPIFLKIPEDRKIAEAYSRGVVLIDVIPELTTAFRELIGRIKKELSSQTGKVEPSCTNLL